MSSPSPITKRLMLPMLHFAALGTGQDRTSTPVHRQPLNLHHSLSRPTATTANRGIENDQRSRFIQTGRPLPPPFLCKSYPPHFRQRRGSQVLLRPSLLQRSL